MEDNVSELRCKNCDGLLAASAQDWQDGSCPHCGAYPPAEITPQAQSLMDQYLEETIFSPAETGLTPLNPDEPEPEQESDPVAEHPVGELEEPAAPKPARRKKPAGPSPLD
jgi:hypothetical protein